MNKRQKAWNKTNGRCGYCGAHLQPVDRDGYLGWHLEHIHPKSRGGSNSLYNLIPACPTCNLRKHDFDVEDYRGRTLSETRTAAYDLMEAIGRMGIGPAKDALYRAAVGIILDLHDLETADITFLLDTLEAD